MRPRSHCRPVSPVLLGRYKGTLRNRPLYSGATHVDRVPGVRVDHGFILTEGGVSNTNGLTIIMQGPPNGVGARGRNGLHCLKASKRSPGGDGPATPFMDRAHRRAFSPGKIMEKIFRKARQNRIFQDVVEQVQDAIVDGRLTMGDRLPAERELCEMFGTSRGTLREALRVLEQKGLVEIRLGVGGGAVVKDANADAMSDSLAMLIRSRKISLDHLAEFREDVEGTVTGLAARRARKADVALLRSLLDQARRHHDAGLASWDEFVRVDETLHMTLARIAGNPLYIFILQTIHENIQRYYDRFLTAGETELKENYEDLCAIVASVEEGDARKARRLARDHVRRFRRHMTEKRGGESFGAEGSGEPGGGKERSS